MSEQRYDLLQFAEWLKSDTTPNGGAALWEASALYDFQVDPNTNEISTQQFNQEYSNYLQEESFPALRQRIENIVKVAPQLKDKSLLYKPVGLWERGLQGAVKPLERLFGGEGYARIADVVTNELSPLTKNRWEADEFKQLENRLRTFADEGQKRLDNGEIIEE